MATIVNWKVGTWSEHDHDTRWKAPNLTCLVCLLILLEGIGINLTFVRTRIVLPFGDHFHGLLYISHFPFIDDFPSERFLAMAIGLLGSSQPNFFWNTTGWSPGAKKTHRFWPSRMLYSAFGRSMPMTRGCLDCLDERLFELWWVVFGMFLGLDQQKWPYKPTGMGTSWGYNCGDIMIMFLLSV